MKRLAFALFVVVGAMGVTPALAGDYYFALGDSVAEGYQPTDLITGLPTNGDRGYVSIVADKIGALQGARPTVVNLAIPAETSSAFYDLTNPYYYANTNYPSFGNPRTSSQYATFTQRLSSALGTGNTVSHVSLALGSNDLLDLQSDPNFINGDSATKQAMLANTLSIVSNNYITALTYIKTSLPKAQILLPGYYNPTPTSQTDQAIGALNTLISNQATAFGGTYVDFFTPIRGKEAQLTWIAYPGVNDIHPNDLGYAALGAAASAKVEAVPEPATCAALALGFAAVCRRRKTR